MEYLLRTLENNKDLYSVNSLYTKRLLKRITPNRKVRHLQEVRRRQELKLLQIK